MLKDRIFLLALAGVIGCSTVTQAQILTRRPTLSPRPSAESKSPFSLSVAQRFYTIAFDLANSENITGPQAEQAIILLTAAKSLGADADDIEPMLIKLACKYSQKDYSQEVANWLVESVSEFSDLDVPKEAVTYLLEKLNSPEQREKLLGELLRKVSGKNAVFDSELATMLGLLKLEEEDTQAAKYLFVQAYRSNRYNKLAFAKLAELMPDEIGPPMYLEHLRLALRTNPLDIGVGLAFAQYAERLQLYDVAAGAYEYCADLFAYLYPTEPLPPHIYIPWVISNYNTDRNQHKCLQIAKIVRGESRFDILLEALAGRAAEKIGNTEEANKIFRAAEEKAWRFLEQGPGARSEVPEPNSESNKQIGAKQFAWFYCFAAREPAKALDWANKAYSTEPNSPVTAGILAYALVMNDQLEWAKPLLESYDHTQIADLVQAQIQLAEGQSDPAIETLRSTILRDPGSLAAERAKEILVEQNADYIPPVDPNSILNMLKKNFGQTLIPQFVSPDKVISIQFNIQGNEFSYGSTLEGTVAVINNSDEPLVIADDGLFQGYIRVDASITGDFKKEISNLISRRVCSTFIIPPSRGILVSLPLIVGELREILSTYPQASLNVEFTLYLDPATTEQGKVTSRLVDIKPVKVTANRPGLELTAKYLRNRFNSISTGQPGQKAKTAQLFVGLLKEQNAMARHGTLYRFKYADWMPTLLTSALLHESGLLLNTGGNSEWIVKVNTMAEMLTLPLDHELINAVAENLNNDNWPVRLMVIYLLSRNPGAHFDRVLDWVAKYDSNELVREMAIALGATETKIMGQ